jgi:hypothetical protein
LPPQSRPVTLKERIGRDSSFREVVVGKRAKREQRKAERAASEAAQHAQRRAQFLAELAEQRCPNCGSASVAKFMYGIPRFTPELNEDLDANRVILGGCSVWPDDPLWACLECKSNWGRFGDRFPAIRGTMRSGRQENPT